MLPVGHKRLLKGWIIEEEVKEKHSDFSPQSEAKPFKIKQLILHFLCFSSAIAEIVFSLCDYVCDNPTAPSQSKLGHRKYVSAFIVSSHQSRAKKQATSAAERKPWGMDYMLDFFASLLNFVLISPSSTHLLLLFSSLKADLGSKVKNKRIQFLSGQKGYLLSMKFNFKTLEEKKKKITIFII